MIITLGEDNAFKTKDVLFVLMFLVFTLGIFGFLISPPLGFIMLAIGFIMMGILTAVSMAVAMPFAIIMILLAIITGNYLSR
jgi:hypothetical protein